MQRLYSDGGCVGANPSPIGGTWAWVLVDCETDEIIASAAGYIPANDGYGPLITNNVSELMAAVAALEALPAGWKGELCSDSQVTLGRLFKGQRFNGVPLALYARVGQVLKRNAELGIEVTPVLVQGHPTRADLAAGFGKKRGLPVSKWNVHCDHACQKQAEYWKG